MCHLTIMERYDISVKFITILDYLELTKKSYSNVQEKEEIDSIMKAGILVLDDIGVEVKKDWIDTTLYRLINYRYSSKLISIFTSNFSIEDLKIDDRIKDRINSICIPLHIPEISIRTMRSNEENEKFIETII